MTGVCKCARLRTRNFAPIAIGQHDIQQDQIVAGNGKTVLCLCQCGGMIYRVTIQRQPLDHGLGQFGVIFDQQIPARVVPFARRVRLLFSFLCSFT